MTGATRRAFQAEMTLKYGDGHAHHAEEVFGWGRQNVGGCSRYGLMRPYAIDFKSSEKSYDHI